MSTYLFGETTYRKYIWVKGGASFHDPQALSLELASEGPFRVEVYDGSALAHTYRKKGLRANWTSLYFDGHGVDDDGQPIVPLNGYYRFRLVNEGSGARKAARGELQYA